MSKNNYFPTILVVIMLIAGFTTGTNAANWDTMFTTSQTTSIASSVVEPLPEMCLIRFANTKTGEFVDLPVPTDIAIAGNADLEADYINKITLLSKECECIGTLVSEPEYKTFYTPFILDKDGCSIKTSYLASSFFLFCTQTDLVKKL
jgi:hypothetical protein